MLINKLDKFLISEMRTWGIPILRIALGIVFLWFGLLKLTGASPVAALIANTYSFFPQSAFIIILGIWETLIGVGLVFKLALRVTLILLWLQMAGTIFSLFLSPWMFFSGGNPLLLTIEGEFIVKNFVLIASGLVIGGYEIKNK